MTKLKISLHGNLYFLIHESLKMHSCYIFSLSVLFIGTVKNRRTESTYYFAKQT